VPNEYVEHTLDLNSKFANAEIAVNEHGGKQSKLEFRYDLISPAALNILAHVLWYGFQRYGKDNWKKIPTEDHLNHALYHIYAHLAGNSDEDHLGHAFTRLMMAIEIDQNGMTVPVLNPEYPDYNP
jgi:hypothetical protein